MEIPENKRSIYREKYVQNRYPEFYKYIKMKYPDIPYNEAIYRYMNKIDSPPICPVCGNEIKYRNSPAGYGTYCSFKCSSISEERIKKIEDTKTRIYNDPHYCNKKKREATCIKLFGVPNVFNLKEYQDKAKQIKLRKYGDEYYSNHELMKQTMINRYGVDNAMKNPEIQDRYKKTMNERYGVDFPMLNNELAKKCAASVKQAHEIGKFNEAHKSNHSFNISKIEHNFIEYLRSKNIDFIYQYRSDLYPFNCDFYLPLYDLYIEIQGNWTHGGHRFNPENNDDINKLNLWKSKKSKYYKTAIYVWTDLDVRKREYAENNKLRYLEIFSIDLDYLINELNNFINKLK